jgi:hypothetical protein
MADRVRKVNYCYTKVPNNAGQGEEALRALRDAGVNLLAYSGFPIAGRKAQMDFIPENMSAFKKVARKNGWRLSKVKKGFLITGQERVGAVHRHLAKLSDAKINVTAVDALGAGKGRYGMILWVKPKQYARAARVLGAKMA